MIYVLGSRHYAKFLESTSRTVQMVTAVLSENRRRINSLIRSAAQFSVHYYEYDRLKMDIINKLVAIGISLSDAGEILNQLGIH